MPHHSVIALVWCPRWAPGPPRFSVIYNLGQLLARRPPSSAAGSLQGQSQPWGSEGLPVVWAVSTAQGLEGCCSHTHPF